MQRVLAGGGVLILALLYCWTALALGFGLSRKRPIIGRLLILADVAGLIVAWFRDLPKPGLHLDLNGAVLWLAVLAICSSLLGALAGLASRSDTGGDWYGQRRAARDKDAAAFRSEIGRFRQAARDYHEAKQIYDAYVSKFSIAFLDLAPEQMSEARDNPDLQHAEALYSNVLDSGREMKDLVIESSTMCQLGLLHHLQGRFDDAERELCGSLEVLQSLPQQEKNNRLANATVLHQLALLDFRRGNRERAIARMQEAHALNRAAGSLARSLSDKKALDRFRQSGNSA